MPSTAKRAVCLAARPPPLRRLEDFMGMEAVIDYMLKAPGRFVTLHRKDAPMVQTAAKMRGLSLPLLTIRGAIERLSRP